MICITSTFTVGSAVRKEAASRASFTRTSQKTNLKQRIGLFWKREKSQKCYGLGRVRDSESLLVLGLRSRDHADSDLIPT